MHSETNVKFIGQNTSAFGDREMFVMVKAPFLHRYSSKQVLQSTHILNAK
jgi:hypothetical protein